MEISRVNQLRREGASAEEIGYIRGYNQGVEDTLQRVSDWIDEETLQYVREMLIK